MKGLPLIGVLVASAAAPASKERGTWECYRSSSPLPL